MADLRANRWFSRSTGPKLPSFMAQSDAHIPSLRLVSAPVQGALYMTAAAVGFSVMNVLIRSVSDELDPLQIAFFRNFFALLFMLPWLAKTGREALRTERMGLHLWRAGVSLAAMTCWFYSLTLLPLAEAVALNFTTPLFATVGAALVLGEIAKARRWSATLIGFLGVLIIVQPGFAEMTWPMALPILAAAFMAVATLVVKSLSETESPAAIVLYMNLILTPLSLVPALFVWQWPSAETWVLLLLLGGVATLSHLCLTRSYSMADASAVLPFDYTRLPFVALFAYLIFGEVPGIWTWVGGAVIAGAAIYIARREAQVAREREVRQAAGQSARGRA